MLNPEIKDRTKRYKLTDETKRKISLALRGKKNANMARTGQSNGRWKGESVKYRGLHDWISHQLIKPEFCQSCERNRPYDLANISGLYLRDLKDWEWLCRKCHMVKDGRIKIRN